MANALLLFNVSIIIKSMKLFILFAVFCSEIIFPSSKLTPLLEYHRHLNPQSFNMIVFINQVHRSAGDQIVLNRLLRKSDDELMNQNYKIISREFYKKGYQLIIVTFLNRNELFHPIFNNQHMTIQYPLRRNKYTLNSERNIISNAFSLLDEFVAHEVHPRPLFIVFHMPPKSLYGLEKKPNNDQRSFESRRDFSLVNLYHELHRRRYLYPNKVLIYPNLAAHTGILINN
jgi:hypothetical protein